MKLLIQHRHGDEISGVTTYVNLVRPELIAQGVETTVVSTRQHGLIRWVKNIAECDLVHMNSNHLGFMLLCRLFGKKVIIKYHFPFYKTTHDDYEPMPFGKRLRQELWALRPRRNRPLKWKLFAFVNYLRLAIRVTTACLGTAHIACSEFMGRSLDFPWPVDTLYNPIRVQPNPEKTVEQLGQNTTFTFVGRVEKAKGVDLLLKAVAKIAPNYPHLKLCIVGSGPALEIMMTLTKELGITNQVDFKGRLDISELLPIVCQSLALVVPSRIQDPAPYVALEAASVATCAIVSEVGGLPEVAGPPGFTFESGDVEALAAHLKYALDHPEMMLKRGQQAYHYVQETFSPTGTARQLRILCERLVSCVSPRLDVNLQEPRA